MRTRTKGKPEPTNVMANYTPLSGASRIVPEYVAWAYYPYYCSLSQIEDIAGKGRQDKPCTHFQLTNASLERQKIYYNRGSWAGKIYLNYPFFVREERARAAANVPYSMPNPSVADVWDRLSNPFGNNFTETLLGIGETRSLLESVRSRMNFLRNVPRAIRGIPGGLNPRALATLGKTATKSTLTSYLEWEFGWKQTGEDLARLLAFVGSVEDHMRKMEQNQGKLLRSGFKRDGSGTFSLDSEHEVSYAYVSRLTYRFKYQYTYSGLSGLTVNAPAQRAALRSLQQLADFWGVNRSPGNAWAVMPASWFIDQFIPIGDFLDDLGTVGWYGVGHSLTFAGSVSSVTIDAVVKRTAEATTINNGDWKQEAASASANVKLYKRSISFSPPPMMSVRNPQGLTPTGKAFAAIKLMR